MLPFPNVPCSLTPPQSPVTIASCGDLLLPSSQYDELALEVETQHVLVLFSALALGNVDVDPGAWSKTDLVAWQTATRSCRPERVQWGPGAILQRTT